MRENWSLGRFKKLTCLSCRISIFVSSECFSTCCQCNVSSLRWFLQVFMSTASSQSLVCSAMAACYVEQCTVDRLSALFEGVVLSRSPKILFVEGKNYLNVIWDEKWLWEIHVLVGACHPLTSSRVSTVVFCTWSSCFSALNAACHGIYKRSRTTERRDSKQHHMRKLGEK